MVYADLDERALFSGRINRPVMVPSREFILAQADKCEAFITTFKSLAQEKTLKHGHILLEMHSRPMVQQNSSRGSIILSTKRSRIVYCAQPAKWSGRSMNTPNPLNSVQQAKQLISGRQCYPAKEETPSYQQRHKHLQWNLKSHLNPSRR